MAGTMAAIQREHRNMGRLLDLLERQIVLFEQTVSPDYDLIREIIDYFLTYPDLYHHPKEDLIYRKLLVRDPQGTAAYGDLEEKHRLLSDRLHVFTHAVVNVMLEAEIPRDSFVGLARNFIEGERKHMRAEEEFFLPAAMEKLTGDDWREIDAKVERFIDPLGNDDIGSRFCMLNAQIADWRAEVE